MKATNLKQRDAGATQQKLLTSALESFSTRGFDASSTRQIEEQAGVKRGLINYHFGSKRSLWEASVSALMTAAESELAQAMKSASSVDSAARLRFLVRAYVKFCARHPELNRLMIQEGMHDDWRLAWLIDRSVGNWYRQICALFDLARAEGNAPAMDYHNFYYILTGAATLMFSNAVEASKLTGKNLMEDRYVDEHAEVLANLLFPQSPQKQSVPQ